MSVVLHAACESLLGALGKASLEKKELPCTEAVVTAYDVILHLWREATEICAEVENGDVVLDVFTMEGDGIVRICGQAGKVI